MVERASCARRAFDPTEKAVDHAPRKAPLTAPVSADFSVREGRDAYLAENGFRAEDYDAPRTPASLLGVSFSVPNTPAHRRAIMQHDLHHVATGFGTDPVGEGEISIWEARNGLGPLDAYVRSLVVLGSLAGVALAPRRLLRAFRAARGADTLFGCVNEDYESLLRMSVGDLRAKLGIPREGLARQPRRLHSTAPREAESGSVDEPVGSGDGAAL